MDDSISVASDEASTQLHCTPGAVRPCDDAQLSGKDFAAVRANDASAVWSAVDGTGDEVYHRGYFSFVLEDATGVAAMDRAVDTLDVT